MPVDLAERLASGCAQLAAGFDACARHARDAQISEPARRFVEQIRATAAQAACLRAPDGKRGPRTSERLRWEWLASTATSIDGAPDARLVAECLRVARSASEDVAALQRALGRDPRRQIAEGIAGAIGRAREALGRLDAVGRDETHPT